MNGKFRVTTSDEIDKSAGPEDKETNLQKKIDELQEEDEQEEDTLIKRVSKCGNYRVKIKGLEETARRSGVTIEDLKSVLGTGKLLQFKKMITAIKKKDYKLAHTEAMDSLWARQTPKRAKETAGLLLA